jgi:hypothetical protein
MGVFEHFESEKHVSDILVTIGREILLSASIFCSLQSVNAQQSRRTTCHIPSFQAIIGKENDSSVLVVSFTKKETCVADFIVRGETQLGILI